LTFGGPDPYLYLSAVQGTPGQSVTETLYLDVTDPNGIQLTALDEAIGFDASDIRVSNVRSAAGLGVLGSYATASTVDNNTGVLLVGQAFMGAGLPPVVPYGTDVAVLQFDVTLNADAAVGTESGITLLENGTIDGQLKYTAISDNEGALTWTAGKAPSNAGNPAIDGSVSVVPEAVSTSAAISQAPASEPTAHVSPKVRVSARSVPPTLVPIINPTDEANTIGGSSDEPVVIAATTAPLQSGAADIGVVQSVVNIPPQTAVSVAATPAATVDTVPTSSLLAKVSDPSAALSLAAQGANHNPASTGTATSVKPLTSVLDEIYSHQNSESGGPMSNYWTGSELESDTIEESLDPWYLASVLMQQDSNESGNE
jgi:hypothetical protein